MCRFISDCGVSHKGSMIELFSFFPLASEGHIGRPDRTMRNGTDSQRGAEPISVKKSPFDCDAATTVEKANLRL
jgi:hypothetical protein